jgi:hypothetical protein
MKSTSELFQLIKSLSKSEKRYFKLYSSLQSGDKNYLKLFDAIEKQKNFNEKKLRVKLKNESFIKHLPSEKNHLYNNILKTLRLFYSEVSINSLLRELIQDIENLYNKALYKECNKILIKAKKIAYQHEKFSYIVEIIHWEKQLVDEEWIFGKHETTGEKINREEEEVVLKIKNLGEYQKLCTKIHYLFRKGGYSRGDEECRIVKEVLNHSLISGSISTLSVRALIFMFYTKGLCAITKKNWDETIVNFKTVIQKMDANPLVSSDMQSKRIKTLRFLLLAYIEKADYINFFNIVREMRSLLELSEYKNIHLRMKILSITSNAELLIHSRLGEFEKGVQKAEYVIDEMKEFQNKLSKETEVLLQFNLAHIYFGAGKFHKALFWINQLLNDNQCDVRQDITSIGRLLSLLIHYELGNSDLLNYISNSTQRIYLKTHRDYQFEMLVLKSIKKLTKPLEREKKTEVFEELKKEILELTEDENEKIVLKYFDFVAWLDAKILNKPFAEITRTKYSGVKLPSAV